MKPIRTTDLPALHAALSEVNGRATTHTASVGDITRWADAAEAKLEALGISKADRIGAALRHESGEKLPGAYSARSRASRVKRTWVCIERRATGWFVTRMIAQDYWPQAQPASMLVLSSDQDAIAIAALRRGYKISQGDK
jgi:hypothetical protein